MGINFEKLTKGINFDKLSKFVEQESSTEFLTNHINKILKLHENIKFNKSVFYGCDNGVVELEDNIGVHGSVFRNIVGEANHPGYTDGLKVLTTTTHPVNRHGYDFGKDNLSVNQILKHSGKTYEEVYGSQPTLKSTQKALNSVKKYDHETVNSTIKKSPLCKTEFETTESKEILTGIVLSGNINDNVIPIYGSESLILQGNSEFGLENSIINTSSQITKLKCTVEDFLQKNVESNVKNVYKGQYTFEKLKRMALEAESEKVYIFKQYYKDIDSVFSEAKIAKETVNLYFEINERLSDLEIREANEFIDLLK